ncbi:TIGR04372 family glycosyltransferase, partial [Candidatus Pelagibacter sp.]|nr:TIGR04372 family glycosyltransferase [Candidatus Pelagibacter sp.]
GPASFANLFNIPTLITNVTSYNHFFAHKKIDLVLLKKIFDTKKNKLIKFKKIFGSDLCSQYSDNQMLKYKLKYIQNSEFEILDATKEMINKTYNKTQISKLQINTKKIIPVNVGSYYSHSFFPNTFIIKNLKLFL